MTVVLILLLVNGALGAWDTLYYHEYKAKLASRLDTTATELKLHAARDFVYVGVYGVLGWWRPEGVWAWVIALGLAAEVAITMTDFVVEDRDRPAIGGIAPGERVLHSTMAIVYGAMLTFLVPLLVDGFEAPTALASHDAPLWMSLAATAAAIGIAGSGLRDLLAVLGIKIAWVPAGARSERSLQTPAILASEVSRESG